MNRYSLIFALLFASSYAVHPPQAVDKAAYPDSTKKPAAGVIATSADVDPTQFIQRFLDKAAESDAKQSAPKQKDEEHSKKEFPIQVLFATVPHPIETHLATEFDNDVSALVDGLQDSGYLFDSSWIPWNHHGPRDQFNDDIAEKNLKEGEDNTPGILFFRRKDVANNSYENGIIVFLLSEKPTEGIAFSQVHTAVQFLKDPKILQNSENRRNVKYPWDKIGFSGQIRILGPTFSGSFASLIPIVNYLKNQLDFPAGEKILIRSGSATVGNDAVAAMKTIANQMPPAWVDFGSAEHDDDDWTQAAAKALYRMGIEPDSVATLNEGESAFGDINKLKQAASQDSQNKRQCPAAADGDNRIDTCAVWKLSYPRDISSLRADYEKQGILDAATPAPPWKHFLNVKSDEQNDGDSVRSFGGENTLAAQESILLGISEFLKTHQIRAVMISASNEEDCLFLTQFLHAHNGNVRVVVVGATRVFMRGQAAQFRGDLMVDSFPMLPRLHDWTRMKDDYSARIFADSEAHGTYFATIDLFAQPQIIDGVTKYKWFPEYSEPFWTKNTMVQQPPMYVVALGDNATWPVAEDLGTQFPPDANGAKDSFSVKMPFTLFAHDLSGAKSAQPSIDPTQINVGGYWEYLFYTSCFLTALYGLCFWIANPMSWSLFASFETSPAWRFWLFKVAIPAATAGCAIKVLAWAVDLPAKASPDALLWWSWAEGMTFLAPLIIAVAAAAKVFLQLILKMRCTRYLDEAMKYKWAAISFVPALVALVWLGFSIATKIQQSDGSGMNIILNAYREMHWESGLSLVPTWIFFLSALWVWALQAGNGAALMEIASKLPRIDKKPRISQKRARIIQSFGRPLPFNQWARWMWAVWVSLALIIVLGHLFFPPFKAITTLEPLTATHLVRWAADAIMALILLDVLQFLGLWNELRGLLRSLNRETFKRSFVPINDFNWRQLWSIGGIPFHERMAILGNQIECLGSLKEPNDKGCFAAIYKAVEKRKEKYSKPDSSDISSTVFRKDLRYIHYALAAAGTLAYRLIQKLEKAAVDPENSPSAIAAQSALAWLRAPKGGRYDDETSKIAELPPRQQAAEKLLCLLYIGFIQTVIARLHTLLISVGLMFSLAALGVAIYPFAPIAPFLVTGFGMMLLIGWAFFKIFSEMDRDPILSRIVNGDDRKLQGSFYLRFTEAIALPVLTLASSFLPGGAGRLLELVQTLLSHGQ
jgi:hypothetical protein